MDYTKIYQQLIERAQQRALSKKEANEILGYSEAHHILPRCMDGTDEIGNIAHLSAREHFIAHLLLVKIYPNDLGLINSVYMMSFHSTLGRMNNRLYDWVKRKRSILQSENQKGTTKETNARVAKQSKTVTGRTKETHEYKAEIGKKLSLQRKGKTATESPRVAKMAKTLTGRNKFNHEGIARMAEKQRGKSKETHPSVASQAEKMAGRTKETHSGVKQQSEKMTGRTKFTHSGLKISSEKQRKLNDEQEYKVFCLRNNNFTWSTIQEYFEISGITLSYAAFPKIFKRVQTNISFDLFYYKEYQ
jgi:hypothetical protein